MILHIPQQDRKEWRGIFPGKYFGNLYQTWNIDLERTLGRLALSGRSRLVLVSSDTSFSTPKKFLRTNADGTDRYWGLTSNKMLRSSGSDPRTGWGGDTLTGTPASAVDDMIVHGDSDIADSDPEDRLLVSLDTELIILNKLGALKAWDTDWWSATDSDSGLGQTALTNTDHPMARLNKLVAIGDGKMIHTIDQNDVVNYNRLSTPTGFAVNIIYDSPNYFWFGLKSVSGTTTKGIDGKIARWDGSDPLFNNIYPFQGIPITGWVKSGIPYFINQFGQIMKFTGESFEEVARFPMIEEDIRFSVSGAGTNFISKHGCVVDVNLVKILVGVDIKSTRMRAGIWIFNTKNNNLYHHRSVGMYNADSDLDFGQGVLFRVGGIANTRGEVSGNTLLVGANHYTDYTSTTVAAIYRFLPNEGTGDLIHRGYFVSSCIPAKAIQDVWDKLWIRFKKFIHNNNRIIVKFRTEESLQASNGKPMQTTITWITSTTFKGPIPSGVEVSDEVEVLAGKNAGCSFNISALDTTPNGSSTITATIDEATSVSDTTQALARFDNWKKVSEFSDTSLGFADFPLTGSDSDDNPINIGEFIQFKIELRGKANEVEELILVLKDNLKAE